MRASGHKAGGAAGKPARESFWNLGNITALIALCSFFFGVGTWADLSHQPLGTPTASAVRLRYIDEQRSSYVNMADQACHAAVSKAPTAAPEEICYNWTISVLTLRRQMARDWSVLGTGALAAADSAGAAEVWKMLADFRAADVFWAATADALKARDVAGHNTNLGLFSSADGAFHQEAVRFGLTTCAFAWPSVPPW